MKIENIGFQLGLTYQNKKSKQKIKTKFNMSNIYYLQENYELEQITKEKYNELLADPQYKVETELDFEEDGETWTEFTIQHIDEDDDSSDESNIED